MMEIIETNRQFKCEPVSHCVSNMDVVDNALNYAMEVIPRYCGGGGPSATQQPPAMPPMEYGERRERVLLRPWLENLINSGYIPGLEWIDEARTMFKVPWKHRSKKNWSLRHSSVFLEWAKNTGRWKEGDPEPNYAQLKTRLRCAFNKAPDIDEMKELHCTKSEEPYKVYRFTERRDGKSRPLVRMFVTKTSCGPHVVRRRRRPKQLLPSRPLLNMVGSNMNRELQHSVPGLKMEPPGEMESWTQEMECRWKAEMQQQSSCDYIIPRNMTGGYPPELSHHMSVKMDRYSDDDYKPVMLNGGCSSARPSVTPCRILPPPEEEYCMPSPPDWTPPFPLTSRDATAGHDSRLLILQAASEVVEATDRQRHVYVEYENADVYDRMPPRASSEPMLHPVSSPAPVQPAHEDLSSPKPSAVVSSESEQTSSPSCDVVDDSAPPLVRFKKRYLRAQQLAERHQLSIDTAAATAGAIHAGDTSSSNVSPTSPSELFNEHSPVKLSPTSMVDGRDVRDVMAVEQRERQRAMPRDWSPVHYGTVLPEKRSWSRITEVEQQYRDQSVEMTEQRCDVGPSPSTVNSPERYAVYEPQSKRRHIMHRRSIDGSADYTNYPPQNLLPNGRPSLAGCNDTVLYREVVPCSPQSLDSVAVNLSYNKVESPSSQHSTEAAIDLTKRNPLSHADFVRQPLNSSSQYGHPMERKLVEQWNRQITPKPELMQGANETKEFVRVEADIQRKSNLIVSKTAVLFDRERKLRELEKELVAREEALYWQEHQLPPPDVPVSMRSPVADRCQLPAEDRYPGEAVYRDVRHLAPATVERLQAGPRILPSHDGSQSGVLNNSGWPVEKLEEQFARLVKTSQDVLPAHKSTLCSPPTVQMYEDEYALQMQKQRNETRMPQESYTNGGGWHDSMSGYHNLVARKRGRPKGSKTRMHLKDVYSSASFASPMNRSHEQDYLRNYYGNTPASQEGRMDGMPAPLPPPPLKTEFPRQTYFKPEPVEPRNVAVDGFVSPSTRRIFSGGQVVAADRTRVASSVNARSVGMPPKVRQMLETTAGTTGASILPPLSPAPAANEADVMCRRGGPAYRTTDDFVQHSATPNHHQHGHYAAVAPVNVSRTQVQYENDFGPMAQSPYRVANGSIGNRPETVEFLNHRPSSDREGCVMNPKWRNNDGGGNASHILPNIGSFDRDRDVANARVTEHEQWNVAKRNRVEEWRRSVVSSCTSSTVDGDDSNGRLVIAFDGE